MTRRRIVTAVAAVALVFAVAVPVFVLAGDDPDLKGSPWLGAVLLRDDRGPGGTLVVMYDTGLEDRARRLRLTLGGVAPQVGISVDPQKGIFKPLSVARCAKARIERVPPTLPAGTVLTDAEGDASDDPSRFAPGFVAPPPRLCRTLPIDLVERRPAPRKTYRKGARLIYAEVVRGPDPALLLVHDRGVMPTKPVVTLAGRRIRLVVTTPTLDTSNHQLGCVELPGRFEVRARGLVDVTTGKRLTENLGGEPATDLREFGVERSQCLRARRAPR